MCARKGGLGGVTQEVGARGGDGRKGKGMQEEGRLENDRGGQSRGRQQRGGVWPSPGWPLHLPSWPLALLPTLPAYCLSPQLPFACLLGSPSPITRPRLWDLLMSPPLLDSPLCLFSSFSVIITPPSFLQPPPPHTFFFLLQTSLKLCIRHSLLLSGSKKPPKSGFLMQRGF